MRVVGLDTTYRFWRKADWITEDVGQVFSLHEGSGHLTVKQSGVYLIYAQVIRSALLVSADI